MKAFVAAMSLAAGALAAPEADPQYLVGASPLLKTIVPAATYAAPAVGAPLVYTHQPAVQYVKPVEYKTEVKKVEVEAKPVTTYKVQTPLAYNGFTAPVVYNNQVAYTNQVAYAGTPVAYSGAPVAYNGVPVAYAPQVAYQPAQKVYHAKNGEVEHTVINKREAEADPQYLVQPTGPTSSIAYPTLAKTLSAYNKVPVAYQAPAVAYQTAYNGAFAAQPAVYANNYYQQYPYAAATNAYQYVY